MYPIETSRSRPTSSVQQCYDNEKIENTVAYMLKPRNNHDPKKVVARDVSKALENGLGLRNFTLLGKEPS